MLHRKSAHLVMCRPRGELRKHRHSIVISSFTVGKLSDDMRANEMFRVPVLVLGTHQAFWGEKISPTARMPTQRDDFMRAHHSAHDLRQRSSMMNDLLKFKTRSTGRRWVTGATRCMLPLLLA